MYHTERLLQRAYDHSAHAEPFALLGKGERCRQLFQRKSQQNSPYRLSILMNAQDRPYPLREVMDVLVEIDFAGQASAIVSWYAGGIRSCIVSTTDLDDRSYAVNSKPGVCLDERFDSPAAAWYSFYLFQDIWLCEPNVLKKDRLFHPAGGASQPPDGQPRNSC